MLTLATVLVGYALSKPCQTLFDNDKQHQTTSDTATHDDRHSRGTVEHDERQTENSGSQRRHSETNIETQSYTAAKHGTVVKNQHTVGKWAVAEKRSTDF